jgi:hypothetical protein
MDHEWMERLVADLGFALRWDLPKHGHGALLVVAMRQPPTERHFDPELIRTWCTDDKGRGHTVEMTIATPVPLHRRLSWGPIEIVDRLGVSNTFVTFGGDLEAWRGPDGATVVAITSPGPILSGGGHSQPYDRLSAALRAFFARLMPPIDFVPGIEHTVSDAGPAARYAAFLQHEAARLRTSAEVREAYGADAGVVVAEAHRLRARDPLAWRHGAALLSDLGLAPERALVATHR